jgi:hypothetical protein
MKLCSRCGKDIGDNMLCCIACTLKLNDDAIRRSQYTPLLIVAAGRGDLKGCRGGDNILHVRMFHSDQCYCGFPAEAPARRRTDIAWGSAAMSVICRKCHVAIDELLAEARQGAAV